MSGVYEADYVVIGAGAMSLAFVDTILTETDADILIIDRYDKPGGHWRVAYDHVKLHQPSDFYGVNSTPLGSNRIDPSGYNEGLLELASGDELRDYFEKVMRDVFIPSGRVTYLPNTEYLGSGEARHIHSGEEITVTARRRIVDGTVMNVTVPAVTPPPFAIEDGVDVVPPNGLARLARGYDRYVVIGGGKTGVDAALWLLERGVDPARISWVVPRDAWFFNRAVAQSGAHFAESADRYLQILFGSWLESESMDELWDRLVDEEYMYRLSDEVRPTIFRCATVTRKEIEAVRRIDDVVRLGHVRSVGAAGLSLEGGRHDLEGEVLYVDATANGLARIESVPVFGDGTIALQPVVFCQQVYSASFIAHVEARFADDATKNALTAPVAHPEVESDFLRAYLGNFRSELLWAADPEIVQWRQDARLSGLTTRVGTPLPPAGPERDAALESFTGVVTALVEKTERLLEDLPSGR